MVADAPPAPPQKQKHPAWDVIKHFITKLLNGKVLAGLMGILIVYKTPPTEMLQLAKVLFLQGESNTGLSTLGWIGVAMGWFLAITFLLTFIWSSRRTDKIHKAEVDRLANERDKLQVALIGSIQHSRKPKP